jgi:hypothetical protein
MSECCRNFKDQTKFETFLNSFFNEKVGLNQVASETVQYSWSEIGTLI